MVRIVSDSTCDLSEELITQYNITIIPLHILLTDEAAGQTREYEDGFGITPDEIFAWSDRNKKTPGTSAPSIDTAINKMKPLLDEGADLICFAISESMSTCANVIRLAAGELDAGDRVTVINSQNITTGTGLMIIEAALMAERGCSVQEITEQIGRLIPRVRTSFVVDTMVYLRRGGRCNAVTALAGSALKIHPEIIVSDGVMHVGKKYRGKMDRVIMHYVKDLEPDLRGAVKDRVFLTHSGCSEDLVGRVKGYLESLDYFGDILIIRAGGVISSHCGPGTLGVIFMKK